jgi:hypothetical protein
MIIWKVSKPSCSPVRSQQVSVLRLLMIVRNLYPRPASSRARHPARGPMATGSTSSAPGDPPGNARRPHPARPAPRSHAIVTTPRTGPARTGQRDRPDSCCGRHFRIPAALRPEWHAGAGGEGRLAQSGGGYEWPGRSRAPHAERGPGAIFSAVPPGTARTAVTRQPRRAARASPRPPPEEEEALARESRTVGIGES